MASSGLKTVYGRAKATAKTPVSVKIDNNQVLNSTGIGYVYKTSDEVYLKRFLLLGAEGGTMYASEQKLNKENAKHTLEMIKSDGKRVVDIVVDVSDKGLAVKNDAALFVLAMASSFGDNETRAYALANLNRVARISTHLFQYLGFVQDMRGWGRGLKNAVGAWYTDKDDKSLAFQVVKYPSREGWSHRDALRLAHPKAVGTKQEIFHYAVKGWDSVGDVPHDNEALHVIWASEKLKTATGKEVLDLIKTYNLPMEVVPTNLRNKEIYESMIPHAGLTWLIRNLGNLSKSGAIASGQYSNLNAVCDRLTNVDNIKKARIHPLSVLVALNTYKGGKGIRGNGEWPVIQKVVDALDACFKMSFKYLEPSGKRFVYGLDVSGSMDVGLISGLPGITPRIASACMATASVQTESNVETMAFSYEFERFPIGKTESLESVINRMRDMRFGGTNCSLPMKWALENKVEADVFVIFTDSETWAGGHPSAALKSYRNKMGIDAKLVVCGMTATNFTIADPSDPLQLDVVGCSADLPSVISEFAKL